MRCNRTRCRRTGRRRTGRGRAGHVPRIQRDEVMYHRRDLVTIRSSNDENTTAGMSFVLGNTADTHGRIVQFCSAPAISGDLR